MNDSEKKWHVQAEISGSTSEISLICSVHSTFDEIEISEQAWDAFVDSVDSDIYLTYSWCRTWWEFYGAGRELRIYIYKYNSNIVGLIPFFYERQWIGPVWLKIAKVVGADFTIAMDNPPVEDNFSKVIFDDIFDSLFKKEHCDAVWLGPVGEKYKNLNQLRKAIHGRSDIRLLKDEFYSPYITFLLPDTFEAYLNILNKRQRGNLRRDLNLIGRSFQMTQDVIKNEEIGSFEFEKFVQMHTRQWEAEGKLGHFNDWPKGVEFNCALVRRMARNGRLRLLRLLLDGQVVSYQLCYAFGKRWHWRLPSRVVGPAWDKFALGRIGLIKEIEMAIAHNVQEIEAGPGHYDYKIKLGGEEFSLFAFFLVKNQLLCRWRALLFLKLSSLLHFFYYRVWFNRLAPKMSLKRKPLWKLWIRTRL